MNESNEKFIVSITIVFIGLFIIWLYFFVTPNAWNNRHEFCQQNSYNEMIYSDSYYCQKKVNNEYIRKKAVCENDILSNVLGNFEYPKCFFIKESKQ